VTECSACGQQNPSEARFCYSCGTALVGAAETTHSSVQRKTRPQHLLIGEVAQRIGLSLRTVRYYEEMGLLDHPPRTDGGFRVYSEDDVKRLYILKGMKPAGMTLEEIRELMELLDRTERLNELDPPALENLHAGLSKYERRVEEGVDRLERHLVEVQKLYGRIRALKASCDVRLAETDAESGRARTSGPGEATS
jgi:DNA-binding transcriptional MerR regulator